MLLFLICQVEQDKLNRIFILMIKTRSISSKVTEFLILHLNNKLTSNKYIVYSFTTIRTVLWLLHVGKISMLQKVWLWQMPYYWTASSQYYQMIWPTQLLTTHNSKYLWFLETRHMEPFLITTSSNLWCRKIMPTPTSAALNRKQ